MRGYKLWGLYLLEGDIRENFCNDKVLLILEA